MSRRCLALVLLSSLVLPAGARAQRVIDIELVPTERAQIAVWITDMDGVYLETLALTEAVARRGIGNRPGASQMNSGFHWPYGRREGVLPVWAHARADAPGAELFRRVIFQDRYSEGHASRSSNDSTLDHYFCLSFNLSTTSRDALDAVACASPFMSDKGRYITETDVMAGYYEPQEDEDGDIVRFPLDLFSLYPPRRDSVPCGGTSCSDHVDSRSFAADVRRILPEIDEITTATPAADVPMHVMYSVPDAWPDGRYRVLVEVNTEGDYNNTWSAAAHPTPDNPDIEDPLYREHWDYWARMYGYPYRGQPSVVYAVEIDIVPGGSEGSASTPVGYGSLSGQGGDGGDMRTMDGTISNDGVMAPGSGADRLLDVGGSRVRVSSTVCVENGSPTAPDEVSLRHHESRRDAHHFARLSFRASDDDNDVVRYEVRVGTSPITDLESFLAAVPAKAATLEDEALMVPTNAEPGELVDVELGGLVFETQYWVGVRAIDACNAASEIEVAELTTLPIEFTTVSPCFVATAAYGTPLAEEIGVLRRFRDRHLRSSALGGVVVDLYEAFGPYLADFIREDEERRAAARAVLSPIVDQLR